MNYVRLAESAGADAAEIYHNTSIDYQFGSVKKKVETRKRDADEGWGVRVLKGGRLGWSFFTRPERAKDAVRAALKLARLGEKVGMEFTSPWKPGKQEFWDRKVAALDEGWGEAAILGAVRGSSTDAQPTIAGVDWSQDSVEIVNSSGLDVSRRETSLHMWAIAVVGASEGSRAFGSRRLEGDPYKVGKEAASLAHAMRGARSMATGPGVVVLTVQVIDDLVAGLLSSSLSG